MRGALVYEVTCRVEASAVDAWAAWIGPHVEDVLASPGMVGATVARADDEDGAAVFVCAYRVQYRAALDRYLAERAPALRQDGVARFGDRLRTSRRVLDVIGDW